MLIAARSAARGSTLRLVALNSQIQTDILYVDSFKEKWKVQRQSEALASPSEGASRDGIRAVKDA
ncbi:MAG: hypothetical protein ING59_07540 [Burkholderiales bacterium]|nr:hypothetical protein [Burkholderiales bacterium]